MWLLPQISSQPVSFQTTSGIFDRSPRLCKAGSFRKEVSNLKRLNVGCLPALRPLNHIELYSLTLLEALEAARGDCGVMCENVFAVLTADEAKPLGIVFSSVLIVAMLSQIGVRVAFLLKPKSRGFH
jgi:hypothetical protein